MVKNHQSLRTNAPKKLSSNFSPNHNSNNVTAIDGFIFAAPIAIELVRAPTTHTQTSLELVAGGKKLFWARARTCHVLRVVLCPDGTARTHAVPNSPARTHSGDRHGAPAPRGCSHIVVNAAVTQVWSRLVAPGHDILHHARWDVWGGVGEGSSVDKLNGWG